MSQIRVISPTGYYHVTSRGVGQMLIFEGDEDRQYYLRLLKRYRDKYGVRILAWVLMGNHVHLVIDTGKDTTLSDFMHDLNTAYSYYFKKRTEHVGHVFQARFWCGAILSEQQLIATVDYVHRNPVRAQIANRESYRWSSFQEYLGKHWVVDSSTVLELLGGIAEFVSFTANTDDVVHSRAAIAPTDDEVLQEALSSTSARTSGELRKLPRKERNRVLRLLYEDGVTQKQLGRVFGISKSAVCRAIKTSSLA